MWISNRRGIGPYTYRYRYINSYQRPITHLPSPMSFFHQSVYIMANRRRRVSRKKRSRSSRSSRASRRQRGGDCGCNKSLAQLFKGGSPAFTENGTPVNAIPLKTLNEVPPLASERLTGGRRTRKQPRKKGGMSFSSYSATNNNPVVQFGTLPGAGLSVGILTGDSYQQTSPQDVTSHIKPLV